MTTLILYGGPLKRSMIERAFGMCGQSVTEFELTPEEYRLGLVVFNDICATFPDTFTANIPETGDGNAEDESGVPESDVLGITCLMAQEIAQNVGKDFRPNKRQTQAISMVISKYTAIPFVKMGRNTIRGAGNRYYRGWGGPFFAVGVSDDEPAQ